MSLATMTFKLYTDSGLTTAFSGSANYLHKTDLSDNPQDLVLYFGSVDATRKLRTQSSPGTNQITFTPTDTLLNWAATTAYVLGDTREPTTANTYFYECVTAGTSGASEPTWPTSGLGSTVVDGTAVWALVAKKHPITEVKLALTEIGLDSATGGAALNLGTEILGGVSEAIEVHMRVTNTVTTVVSDFNQPQIGIYINPVQEEPV